MVFKQKLSEEIQGFFFTARLIPNQLFHFKKGQGTLKNLTTDEKL